MVLRAAPRSATGMTDPAHTHDAEHTAPDEEDVDPRRCGPEHEMCAVVAEKAARLVPQQVDSGIAQWWCGMRTLTDDGRFVIGFDPELAGLFWVAGLGGHGMVASFEIGRMAAERLSSGPAAPHVDHGRTQALAR